MDVKVTLWSRRAVRGKILLVASPEVSLHPQSEERSWQANLRFLKEVLGQPSSPEHAIPKAVLANYAKTNNACRDAPSFDERAVVPQPALFTRSCCFHH
jgi:hypothetical protein